MTYVPAAQQAVMEWYAFRNKVARDPNLMNLHSRHLYQRFYKNRQGFARLMAVAELVLLIPVDTAEAERGFALMNRLKTASRSKMAINYLNDLMFARLHGPDNLTEYDADQAIKLWLSRTTKGRIIHQRPAFTRPSVETAPTETAP